MLDWEKIQTEQHAKLIKQLAKIRSANMLLSEETEASGLCIL
jgi:hypothetical protein